ncbi:hypothetical protein DV515_00019797 [Chloebia gouldiae]|uniref:Uncharacterized protein n=1 Tax=Chloebia gouldiae TaxID=44316 RepID=A0A3L8Q4J8_CHLGU|nr:hypothetical protein DV515_00019797 [Chloebia gouldiae]
MSWECGGESQEGNGSNRESIRVFQGGRSSGNVEVIPGRERIQRGINPSPPVWEISWECGENGSNGDLIQVLQHERSPGNVEVIPGKGMDPRWEWIPLF